MSSPLRRLLLPLLCTLATGCQFGFPGEPVPDAGPDAGTAPGVLWDELWGQDDADTRGQAIAADPAGGFVLTGVYAMPAYSQLGVQRSRENGDYVLMHAFEVHCPDVPCTPGIETAVAVGSEGATYAVGAFQGPGVLKTPAGDFSVGSAAITAGFVLKLDGAQQHLWTKTLGGAAGRMRLDDLTVVPGGDVAVVGSYLGAQSVGSVALPTSDVDRGFVALLGPEGSVRWARALGTLSPGERRHIAVDIGALVVTDRVSGALTLSWLSLGGQPAGTLAQDLRMLESVRDLTPLPGGGVALVGRYLTGQGPATEASLLLQVTSARAAGWALSSPAQLRAVAADTGGILVSGDFRGTLQLGEERYPAAADFPSIFAARVSLEGKPLSVRSISAQGEGEFSVRGSALLPDGASVHAGYFTAPVDFGTGDVGGRGGGVGAQTVALPLGTAFFLKLAP
jgi:hypothetical protein